MSGWVAAILVAISRGLQPIRTLGPDWVQETRMAVTMPAQGRDNHSRCQRDGLPRPVGTKGTASLLALPPTWMPCLPALPPTWMQADKSLLLFGALLDEIKALGLAEQSFECIILDAHRSGWDRIPWSAADMAAGEEMRQMCRT